MGIHTCKSWGGEFHAGEVRKFSYDNYQF